MNHKLIFYVLELLILCLMIVYPIYQTKKKQYSLYNQQMCYMRLFITSLALYYFCGFFGGIFLFHVSPFSAIFRVAVFMDVPRYALGFLFLSVLYGLILTINAIRLKLKKEPFVENPISKNTNATLGEKIIQFGYKHPDFSWFVCYSLLFVFICFSVFSVNLLKRQGLIWRIDGKSQYLPYMTYMSDYFKELFQNISNGNFTIRMYDFNIGMGEDIRSVVRIHPTEFLSVFFKRSHIEELYDLLMFFRYYLAGLSFYIYCRHKKVARAGILVGAYAYIFSGYGLSFATNHPIFNAPVILLPLILVGLDRVIERKGYLLFSFIVAIFMSINYYFLYISTIVMAFYGFIQFFDVYRKHRIKEFFAMLGRIIAFYILGIAMSAMFFLPTVIRALTSERVGTTRTAHHNLLSYAPDQYIRIFLSTISGKYMSSDIHLSFVVLFLPAIVVLFLGPVRKNMKLKLMIILQFIAVMLPVVGLVMSAFSTINNRWIYVFALTGAYTIAITMDDFRKLKILQQLGLIGITILFYLAYQTRAALNVTHIFDLKTSLVFLGVTVIILLFINMLGNVTKLQATAVMLILSTVSLTMHGCYVLGNDIAPQSETFVNRGEIDDYLSRDEFSRFSKINNSDFYRCDISTMRDHYENTPVVFDYNGTSIYNSVINSNVVNYHTELGSIGLGAVHRIYNLDGRTSMETLASVKYYLVKANSVMAVPYGFKKMESMSDDKFWIYENQHALPIGYTYTTAFDRDSYEKLSGLDKQQAMMQAAVVDKEKSKLDNVSSYVSFDTAEEENVNITNISKVFKEGGNGFRTLEDGTLKFHLSTLKKASATEDKLPSFTIPVKEKKGYETYLKLSGFHVNKSRVPFKITKDGVSKQFIVRNPTNTYAVDRDDYYINLGYSDKNQSTSFDFEFTLPGTSFIKEMKICYVPMANYTKAVANLQKDSLEDVSIEENTVSGNVSCSENEIMVFSIPYSSGWSAKVDGQKVNLFRANTAYMGVALEKGKHSIVLSYETPGLRIGIIVSSISTILFLFLFFFFLFKNKKKKNKEAILATVEAETMEATE